MKRMLLFGFCILLCLSACASAGQPATVAPPDAQGKDWASLYPVQYEEWAASVHGKAYLEGNTDAPGCTGCHADPESGELATAELRVEIPARCARCHADEALMSKYDLAADTYKTYQADYHGATIEYFRAKDPTSMRYEAVCSDCHGKHAVLSAADPKSSVAQANLLATCQQCHPEAGPKFTAASTGHLRTSPKASVLVFLVKLFYLILIPVVLGAMLAYIALDIAHRARKKARGARA